LESIERLFTEQLASWEVPGCAIAAVRDGQTVLTAGWGQRDLDTGVPVTSDTLFAIGSVTKAFTAATVGALVDDGLLEWERPLRDYLPGLRLYDPVVTDRLTVVDLLSHRSGLPRHDLVWLGHPDWSRAEVVRRLRFPAPQQGPATGVPVLQPWLSGRRVCRGGALRPPLGGFPEYPAADAAGDGPLEPVGRRHDR
jgi:CubicO group peptidase (beta-lactamase class C family)